MVIAAWTNHLGSTWLVALVLIWQLVVIVRTPPPETPVAVRTWIVHLLTWRIPPLLLTLSPLLSAGTSIIGVLSQLLGLGLLIAIVLLAPQIIQARTGLTRRAGPLVAIALGASLVAPVLGVSVVLLLLLLGPGLILVSDAATTALSALCALLQTLAHGLIDVLAIALAFVFARLPARHLPHPPPDTPSPSHLLRASPLAPRAPPALG